MERPFSQACDNNKKAILEVLKDYLNTANTVLEVGSGTGQHAAYFAQHLPHLIWQTSDQAEYLAGIRAWVEWAKLDNLREPQELDVRRNWPSAHVSAVFSANTLHIMSWDTVATFIPKAADMLAANGKLIIYGPFNYNGAFTSDSNMHFDQWLKNRDPASGIRDFEAVDRLAHNNNLVLLKDHPMPANNRTLIWQKLAS